MKILCAGAGGFIGGHLVARLLADGHEVRAADIKPLGDWWQVHKTAGNEDECDLRHAEECAFVLAGNPVDWVFNLACDMGGMGFISTHRADCMRSVLINTNLIEAARQVSVSRYFFASSACVYPGARQCHEGAAPLAEDDAYPADPEDGYGWEKLFSERLCRHYREDHGLETRVGRLHNVFGERGSWRDGREKAPAALCRKIAEAKLRGGPLEIWGDGQQTRSFMHVSDAVEGIVRLMASDWHEPLNLGSDRLISINGLADLIEGIAGTKLERRYVDGPQGVRGRCSDNRRCRAVLGWEPQVSLDAGLVQTYRWIAERVAEREFAHAA